MALRLTESSSALPPLQLDQMAEESHSALADLQAQLEEYKDKSRKEITDSQKQAKDRNAEVEKMQYNLGRLQDEVRGARGRGRGGADPEEKGGVGRH